MARHCTAIGPLLNRCWAAIGPTLRRYWTAIEPVLNRYLTVVIPSWTTIGPPLPAIGSLLHLYGTAIGRRHNVSGIPELHVCCMECVLTCRELVCAALPVPCYVMWLPWLVLVFVGLP